MDAAARVTIGNIIRHTAATLHTAIDGLTTNLDRAIAGKAIGDRAQATVPVVAPERHNSLPAVVETDRAVAGPQIDPAVVPARNHRRDQVAAVRNHRRDQVAAARNHRRDQVAAARTKSMRKYK